MSQFVFNYNSRFTLENDAILPELEIAYHTFGKLNADKNNVIWVCHALTANSDVFDWWNGLFGENSLYNPTDYFIVCANNLGSCYGTTGPLSVNKQTKEPWFDYFPQVTIKDMVASFELLRKHLGISKLHTLIGGSQGGQIAMEWALTNNNVTEHLILIATNAQHSPWGIAFNESQRLAIKADRTYYSNTADAAKKGLSAARSIALLSYRGYATYGKTQQDGTNDKINNYAAASYQRYQGEKLVSRFNAYSYVRLLDAMDSHNVARSRTNTIDEALHLIKASALVIGISTDILFPLSEQQFLAKHISNASFVEINSTYGHDGFLIETEKLSSIISNYYQNKKENNSNTKLKTTDN
jgi:homoserine O-acetyltransferase/O-succinyltransferase